MEFKMNKVEKIVLFFKKLWNRKNNKKMIRPAKSEETKENQKAFIDSLKIEKKKPEKRKVETLICPGDGLGIQNKITY